MIYAQYGNITRWNIKQVNEFLDRDYHVIFSTVGNESLTEKDISEKDGLTIVRRDNFGLDIGAWSCVLRNNPELFDSDILVLMNDSCIGPIQSMDHIFDRIESSNVDILGLTDNRVFNFYHIQSYFRVFYKNVLKNNTLREFLCPPEEEYKLLNRLEIIKKYEIGFPLWFFKNKGYKHDCIYQYKKIVPSSFDKQMIDPNQYVWFWERLLFYKFPFIKMSLFKELKGRMSIQDIEFIKYAYGEDLSEYL